MTFLQTPQWELPSAFFSPLGVPYVYIHIHTHIYIYIYTVYIYVRITYIYMHRERYTYAVDTDIESQNLRNSHVDCVPPEPQSTRGPCTLIVDTSALNTIMVFGLSEKPSQALTTLDQA